jgi:hypothetical protein
MRGISDRQKRWRSWQVKMPGISDGNRVGDLDGQMPGNSDQQIKMVILAGRDAWHQRPAIEMAILAGRDAWHQQSAIKMAILLMWS